MCRWQNHLSVRLITFSSICLLLSGCGGGSGNSANLVILGSPALSPDGRKIAFTRGVTRSDGSFRSEDTELYTANLDGSAMTRLTTNQSGEDSPRWSPDGTKIAFSEPGSPICVINADGTGLTTVSPVGKSAFSPDWSPDGQHIVYLATDSTSTEIYVARTDGTDEKRITQRDSVKSPPRWSPDGTRIAFVESGDAAPTVVIIQADGTGALKIPNNSSALIMLNVTWAPDSTKVAFTTQGFRSDGSAIGQLYVTNADGTGQPTAISPLTSVVAPDWSSDGTRFVFVGQSGLASMKVDGTEVRRLPIR